MTLTDVATWAGTGLSISAMGVSIFQARRAKSVATKVEELRDQISTRAQQSELSKLEGLLNSAIRSMDKYGPGANGNLKRGYSPENDAQAVRELTREMTRLQNMLKNKLGDSIIEVTGEINHLLNSFAVAQEVEERNAIGGQIYTAVVELSGNMKKEFDGVIFG